MIIYDAYEANQKAHRVLKNSRSHPRLSISEMNDLDDRMSQLVIHHQSLYHILPSDPSIQLSESTLRRYIDHQYLQCRNIDLPRTVRFPNTKTSTRVSRKRVNIEVLMNRTLQNYQDYTQSHKRTVIQIDTVMGRKNDKKCLLTLYEPHSRFQWGVMIYRTSAGVNKALSELIQTLILLTIYSLIVYSRIMALSFNLFLYLRPQMKVKS